MRAGVRISQPSRAAGPGGAVREPLGCRLTVRAPAQADDVPCAAAAQACAFRCSATCPSAAGTPRSCRRSWATTTTTGSPTRWPSRLTWRMRGPSSRCTPSSLPSFFLHCQLRFVVLQIALIALSGVHGEFKSRAQVHALVPPLTLPRLTSLASCPTPGPSYTLAGARTFAHRHTHACPRKRAYARAHRRTHMRAHMHAHARSRPRAAQTRLIREHDLREHFCRVSCRDDQGPYRR